MMLLKASQSVCETAGALMTDVTNESDNKDHLMARIGQLSIYAAFLRADGAALKAKSQRIMSFCITHFIFAFLAQDVTYMIFARACELVVYHHCFSPSRHFFTTVFHFFTTPPLFLPHPPLVLPRLLFL
jgi:hypothetical protein